MFILRFPSYSLELLKVKFKGKIKIKEKKLKKEIK